MVIMAVAPSCQSVKSHCGQLSGGPLHMVKWGLSSGFAVWGPVLGGCGAGPEASWPGAMWWQVPLMPVTSTGPLQVLLKCPSVSFSSFSWWLSGKEGNPFSLQGRANSKLAHPSLLMSDTSCRWMFRDWHSTGQNLHNCAPFPIS